MYYYRKAVREQAALICAIAASTPVAYRAYISIQRALTGRCSLKPGSAWYLAASAWEESRSLAASKPGLLYEDHHADAEAMIRIGWHPEHREDWL